MYRSTDMEAATPIREAGLVHLARATIHLHLAVMVKIVHWHGTSINRQCMILSPDKPPTVMRLELTMIALGVTSAHALGTAFSVFNCSLKPPSSAALNRELAPMSIQAWMLRQEAF